LGDNANGEAWLYNFTPDVLNSIIQNNGLSGLSYANICRASPARIGAAVVR
jgi:hypothetical protein